MTDAEKLTMIKTVLEDGGTLPSDEKLTVYLEMAKRKILSWRYHLVGGVPDDVTDVPEELEDDQIEAVIVGYTHAGAEGESRHSENGVSRDFLYSDMNDYIEHKVKSIVRVGAVRTS